MGAESVKRMQLKRSMFFFFFFFFPEATLLHLWNYPRILFEVLNDEKKEDEVYTERGG